MLWLKKKKNTQIYSNHKRRFEDKQSRRQDVPDNLTSGFQLWYEISATMFFFLPFHFVCLCYSFLPQHIHTSQTYAMETAEPLLWLDAKINKESVQLDQTLSDSLHPICGRRTQF